MSRWHSYLNSAVQILSVYDGKEPFASYLKKFFAANKKFGSKDRKQVSHLCYCYFRLGKAILNLSIEERVLAALFLCSDKQDELLHQLKPEWSEYSTLPVADKCSILNVQSSISDVFPWTNELSEGIEHEKFSVSFFDQPDLFLRMRPGKEGVVKNKLKEAGLVFTEISGSCISLPNNSKIDSVVRINDEAVVQDLNSQQTGKLLLSASGNTKSSRTVWDCCAGSGGKSIMVKDLMGNIDLTVSDMRESILINLRKRFEEAGIRKYRSFIADLAGTNFKTKQVYDLIIADVPCTGSGTWGRTPEQLCWFEEKKIAEYKSLQEKILSNIIPGIAPGGHLLFITCSVFKKENEGNIDFIKQNFHLELIKMEVLRGYDKKADTMFAALLKKPL